MAPIGQRLRYHLLRTSYPVCLWQHQAVRRGTKMVFIPICHCDTGEGSMECGIYCLSMRPILYDRNGYEVAAQKEQESAL